MTALAVPLRTRHSAAVDSPVAKALGVLTLGLAASAALRQWRIARRRSSGPPAPVSAAKTATEAAPPLREARVLHASSALLGASVFVDSTLEHYRGRFENPGMITPLMTSLMTVVVGCREVLPDHGRSSPASNGIHSAAVAVGGAGSAFHLYNVARRPGGFNWLNLFYAAPIGAPAALSLAGLIGLVARRVADTPPGKAPALFRMSAGRVLSALVSIGLAGSASEAGLLHFRGSFQNPFMWLPVTIPPVASVLMLAAAVAPAAPGRFTHAWLGLTGLLGIGGVGFHAYGVARQMGGWRNASQNVLSGPPLSAPPSFTALALAGLAALSLIRRYANVKERAYDGSLPAI